MRHDSRYEDLDSLDDYELEHSSQDIRGRPLVSPEGERFGIIKDLLVDKEQKRVTAVRLEDGRTCAVEPLVIHDNSVVYGEEAAAHAETGGTAVSREETRTTGDRVVLGERVADHGRGMTVRPRRV